MCDTSVYLYRLWSVEAGVCHHAMLQLLTVCMPCYWGPKWAMLWHTVGLPFHVQSSFSYFSMIQVKLCSQPCCLQKRGATSVLLQNTFCCEYMCQEAGFTWGTALSPSPICHSTSIFCLILSGTALTDVENISVGPLTETPSPFIPSLLTPTHNHTKS